MDAGASEVNVLNRLHFMIIAARDELEHGAGAAVTPTMPRPLSVPRIWPRDPAIFDNYISPEIEKWRSWVSGLNLWKRASDFVRNG